MSLNFDANTFLSKNSYKLERDISFSDHAIFFDPIYGFDNKKVSKGLKPVIGITMIVAGVPSAFISTPFLITLTYSMLIGYYDADWFWFMMIFSPACITCVIFGAILPPRFFKIERTSTEMIFQQGYRKDHIPLNQIQQIALDYEFIGTSDRGVKIRITISLIIPNHTICITRIVNMVLLKMNTESIESQLVKVLTKTLFILGYTPK